jgi:DNA-binding NarL/FixJ family response regulator
VPPAAPPRVLLVDDDPAFAELIKSVLARDGIELLAQAFDGAEGVELAVRLEPDLVLMDIRMPGVDGLEATRRIVEAIPRARVLVVSSSKDREDMARARQAGAIGYLPKDRLTAELRDWIERLSSPEASLETKYASGL